MDKQLRAAATKGQAERAKALLAQGADPNAADVRGNSPLKLAVANGHADVVDSLLSAGALVAARPCGAGLSTAAALLVAAAEARSDAIVDRLLDALGAEERAAALCETDASGWSVLHLACKAGSAHLVKLALAAGAPAGAVIPAHGATALMVAVQNGRTDVLDALLAQRPSAPLVEAADARGWCALHWAAQLGEVRVVEALLEAGSSAALEACADGVGTPLMVAAENAHPAVIEALLARGSLVDATDGQGWCALAIAAGKGHAQIVSQLLGARADVNKAGTSSRRTPLMAAAQSGHLGAASLLLAARADVNAGDASLVSALHLATKNGHAQLVQLLLAAGARADAADAAGQTALVVNAKSGDVRIASLLLEHGAHADHTTAAGVSALALAAKHGHRALIELLIKAGTSHAGELLTSAAASAQMDVLLALVKAGGGMIDVDVLGSALLVAAAHGHRSAVSVLVNAGASVFKQDAAGLSPLMLASANGHVETVRALIKASAPVNAPGGPGANTALSLAARNGRAEVVAELLRHGANVEWRGAGERAPDLLELAHDPQVKAQIVAERQRRDLERELLSAKEEATARREKRRGREQAQQQQQQQQHARSQAPSPRSPPAHAPRCEPTGREAAPAEAAPGADGPQRPPSPGAENSGAAGALAGAAAASAADATLDGPPREGALPSRAEAAPVAEPSAPRLGAAAPATFSPCVSAADTRLWQLQPPVATPQPLGAAPTPVPGERGAGASGLLAAEHASWQGVASAADAASGARYCRTCGVLAFAGHRCRVASEPAAGAPPGLGRAEPLSWRAGARAQRAQSPWRRSANAPDEVMSLEALSAQTAALTEQALAESTAGADGGEQVRRHAQAAPIARRTQARMAGLGASGLQAVIELQMETIRRVEEQARLEKQKLRMLLDLQAQLSTLS